LTLERRATFAADQQARFPALGGAAEIVSFSQNS
jgi:hypothetical protein